MGSLNEELSRIKEMMGLQEKDDVCTRKVKSRYKVCFWCFGAANWGTKSEGEHDVDEANKTDYSKEKSQGLHGWFSRKGGGGSKGWVDCNTCRTNPSCRKTCKACGRKDGEKRKYPACRPTPASCGTPKKGKKWGKKSNESLNEEVNTIRLMMGLSEGKIHVTVNEIPNEIVSWARRQVGSNFSKNIVIKQESRVEIGMPWHEADREYWQFFKLTGTQSATQVGDVVGRSGLEGDGVVTGKEVDGYVDVPSGYVLACAGTYPVRLTLYTADDAMKPVGSGDDLDKLSINQLLILLQAKGLKSPYRDKFPEDEYVGLIAGGYLASNKSITTKGRNMVEDPALKKKIDDYVESKGMYLNSSYKLSKKFY